MKMKPDFQSFILYCYLDYILEKEAVALGHVEIKNAHQISVEKSQGKDYFSEHEAYRDNV